MPLFKKVTIIGFGLIGSSLARAIKKNNLADHITAADINKQVCNKALELNLADQAITDIAAAVKNRDLVIIAVPVGAYANVGKAIAATLAPEAIVTDVGSVKQTAIETLTPLLPKGVHFVPGHPIAGTEHSGPESGFSELFEGRWTIITPQPDTKLSAIEKMTKLWEACGAMVEIMEPKHHDLVLGITSHLPHLIAYTIVGTATDLEDHIKSEVIKFSASGFRDFTRIAASDPVMWRDIFLNNKPAIMEVLQRFNEDLTALQKMIRNDDGYQLQEWFTRTRAIRREIIEAGQANYPSPTQSAEASESSADPKKASAS